MGVDLRNNAGDTIKLTYRHWAVMLTLAKAPIKYVRRHGMSVAEKRN